MLMPGRRGYALNEANGGGWSNGSSVPQNASYDSRPGINPPAEYVASVQIDFTNGFESNANDEFVAYITDGGTDGGGNGTNSSNGVYRYGFNGQERSDELNDDSYTAEFWEYDSRIGRRWNVDPKVHEYESPYATFADNPILFTDPNGDQAESGDPVNPKGEALKLHSLTSNIQLNGANAGTVIGSDNVKALAAEGSINAFTIGNRTFTARYSTKSGEFTRYADQDNKSYKVEDYFNVAETSSANIGTRFLGFLQGVGGLAEMSVGGAAVATPEPTALTKVIGWSVIAHGADNAAAGFTTMWSGESTKTFTEKGLEELGMSPQAASMTNAVIGITGSGILKNGNAFVSTANAFNNIETNAFQHNFKYASRVRVRALEDPVSHNFPYSFDDAILATQPVLKNNGYKMFQLNGTMNDKSGVFEIGLTIEGVIDHRFFRPY
jgi:hypothetical protein